MENQDGKVIPGWQKKAAIFLGGQAFSLFGSMLVMYAILWHLTLTTQSGVLLTVMTLASILPQILISLFAGVWADRYPRKLLIIASDGLTAGATLILALVFLSGYRELWLIFTVAAVRSVGAGIQAPAVNALLPEIVPEDKLIKVNSINGTIQPVVSIISPVASGALMTLAPIEAIFFVDVVTALAAISLMLTLKVPARSYQPAGSGSYLGDLRSGWRYIRRSSRLKSLLVFFAVTMFLVMPAAFLTPLLVARTYGDEVWRLTANEVAFFGGSIAGGLVMTAWGGFRNRFRTLALSTVLWGFLFAGLGLAREFNLYLVLMFLSGVPMPFYSASAITLMQEMVRSEMQGRVFGVQQLITNAAMPVGMLLFGPLADRVAVEILLVAASALMVVPGLWLFTRQHSHIPSREAGEMEMQIGD